jgi:hypothetical protein
MKYLFVLILGIIIFLASCIREDENCHQWIRIINKTDKAIYYNPSSRYPDTIMTQFDFSANHVKIEKKSSKKDLYRSCIEGTFAYTDKLIYFIYDAQTLETTPWDTIVKKNMILKRYQLSLEDLQNLDWTVTFP